MKTFTKKDKQKIFLIAVLVFGITLLHFLTRHGQIYYHIFYRDLYYLPLILGGLWFGLRGAIATSLSITILYLPYILWAWRGFSPEDFDRVMELALFNILAAILGFITDRQKKEERALRESESLAAMGRALSCVAHDMKAPLMAIGSMAKLIRRKKKDTEPEAEKLDVIIHESLRLETMFRDMLDLSRPLELHPVRDNLNELVQRTIPVVSETAEQENVHFETDLQRGLTTLEFDPLRLEQAVINLMINAAQASPPEEPVVIRTREENTIQLLEVEDNGPGIPRKDKGRIFEPFFSTKKEGTGLGLPIVKKIMDAHGARIEIVDKPQGGTIIRLRFPL